MKRSQLWSVLLLGLLVTSSLQADLVVTLGPEAQTLLPDAANQPVRILIATPNGTPVITGLQINAFIGDGYTGASEFTFSNPAVQYEDGSTFIWDSSDGSPATDAPDFPSVLQSSYSLDLGKSILSPSGKLATVYVDTTGYTEGSFNLTLLGGNMGFGSLPSSYFTGSDFGAVSFPNPGVLSIAAVPEPSAALELSCIGILCVGKIACQRARRRLRRGKP